MPFSDVWKENREHNRKVTDLWQLWQKRAFLLAEILQALGYDYDWVLKADKETLVRELTKKEGE